MSYEPEILVSTERDVLDEIRNPFTHAVCWDCSDDDEFDALMQDVHRYSETVSETGKVSGALPSAARKSDDVTFESLSNRLKARNEKIAEEFLGPKASLQACFFNVLRSDQTSNAIIPHTDGPYNGVFTSLNDFAMATGCIPSEYCGKADPKRNHKQADITKAIVFPGRSTYIIDIGKQVHFLPENRPEGVLRLLHSTWHAYEA